MTQFKTILVPVTDAATAIPALEAGFGLAGRFGAHVVGLHVRTDPATAVPLVGEGMSGAMVEEMMSVAETQAAERAGKARIAFDAAAERAQAVRAVAAPVDGVSAQWEDVVGHEEETIARRGRLSDLVVMARPAGGTDAPSLMTLNAALMESGKPLLLAPPTLPPSLGKSVVVAWNGSAEATRAVAFAMPLLRQAEKVTILSLGEEGRASAVPGDELVAYLAWHGVSARSKIAQAGSQAGKVLLDECADAQADLLVMGAYTHSRLRQLILGGVTRHVLNHAEICCLMCH